VELSFIESPLLRRIRQYLLGLPTPEESTAGLKVDKTANSRSGTTLASSTCITRKVVAKQNMYPLHQISALDRERDQDLFESVTEEEIIHLWRSIKGRGLSEDEAWQAVVTGIALDMAFAKSRNSSHIEH
jgi:hypothetical protein